MPTGWGGGGGSKLQRQVYNEVVKPYCRTCHLTAPSSLDWDSFTEMANNASFKSAVCGGQPLAMPQAEQTQNLFWKSPARAHFVGGFQITGACDP